MIWPWEGCDAAALVWGTHVCNDISCHFCCNIKLMARFVESAQSPKHCCGSRAPEKVVPAPAFRHPSSCCKGSSIPTTSVLRSNWEIRCNVECPIMLHLLGTTFRCFLLVQCKCVLNPNSVVLTETSTTNVEKSLGSSIHSNLRSWVIFQKVHMISY